MPDPSSPDPRFVAQLWELVEQEAFGATSGSSAGRHRAQLLLASAAAATAVLVFAVSTIQSDSRAVDRLDIADLVPMPSLEPPHPEDATATLRAPGALAAPAAASQPSVAPAPRPAAAARPAPRPAPAVAGPPVPAVAPRPELLVVERDTADAPGRLVLRSLDGPGHRRVVAGSGSSTRPHFAPDGRRVVYESHQRGDHRGFQIYMADVESGDERRLTFPVGCESGEGSGDCFDVEPRWSPAGDVVAFTRGVTYPGCKATDACSRILLLSPDTGAVVRLVDGWAPHWAPDGSRLSFVAPADSAEGAQCERSYLFTCNGTLHVINRDGTGLRSLGVKGYGGPWSPNGEWIAFDGDHASGEPHQPHLIRPDGSGLHRVLQPGHEQLSWTPDGRLLSTFAVDGQQDVWLSQVDGSGLTRLTTTPANESWPAWRPRA